MAERETGGLAGDRQGAWRRVRNVLKMKFSGSVDRVRRSEQYAAQVERRSLEAMVGEERHGCFWREKLVSNTATSVFKNHNAKKLIWL